MAKVHFWSFCLAFFFFFFLQKWSFLLPTLATCPRAIILPQPLEAHAILFSLGLWRFSAGVPQRANVTATWCGFPVPGGHVPELP